MISNILIAGGDRRCCLLAEELRESGYSVQTIGLVSGDYKHAQPEKANVLLLPYPFSVKNGKIRTLIGKEISFSNILNALPTGSLIFYHGIPEPQRQNSFQWHAYDGNPVFIQENTAISAEGALSALMVATEDTLRNMHCLVTGYGAFGRKLAQMLLTLGCEVTVAARREEALLLAGQDGTKGIPLSAVGEKCQSWNVILNTIPAKVIDNETVSRLPEKCLLMELASEPGGFDHTFAKKRKLAVLKLPGIPGKYAPLAAAKAMKKTVISTLKEHAK